MTDIVISPSLPKWILDTFEGKFIAAWIGFRDHGDLIEFEGDTEDEDNEDIILLRMDADEVAAFAQLGEEAGTQICTDIARLLRDPEGTEIMNEFFGKIDISAIRYELGLPNEKEPGTRMLEVDDLLLSLISRFPDQIPYAEVTWARGATFITPAGVEWFDRSSLLEPRREEYLASLGAPTPAV